MIKQFTHVKKVVVQILGLQHRKVRPFRRRRGKGAVGWWGEGERTQRGYNKKWRRAMTDKELCLCPGYVMSSLLSHATVILNGSMLSSFWRDRSWVSQGSPRYYLPTQHHTSRRYAGTQSLQVEKKIQRGGHNEFRKPRNSREKHISYIQSTNRTGIQHKGLGYKVQIKISRSQYL